MASFAAATVQTTAFSAVHRRSFGISSSSPVLGLPVLSMKGRVSCSVDGKQASAPEVSSKTGMCASLVAAVYAASRSGPAMALVDERLSTEGTGLPFGLSNNLLGWILLGVFGLIWTFYFTYTAGLDEDEDSGLSL